MNLCGDRNIVYLESIDSTMTEAARLAAKGCAAGTVVVADEQTAGQGRHGHSWYSEKGAGLYVSIVLRPSLAPAAYPALTLALGLATAEGIEKAAGLSCDVRWPNDVLLNGKKVAGVLVRCADAAVIAGMGINVHHEHFPPELESEATSLRIVSGRTHSRERLLSELLRAVDTYSAILEERGARAILDLFCCASSYAHGRRVQVKQGGTTLTGVTAGLDPNGFLMLLRDDGATETILAGGVRPA